MMDIIETRELQARDGFELEAQLVPDQDTEPDDFECYSDRVKAAWLVDEWRYVGVIVRAFRTVTLPGHAPTRIPLAGASLWGVEFGDLPVECEIAPGEFIAVPEAEAREGVDSHIEEVIEELIPEALETARQVVAALCRNGRSK